MCYNSTKEPKMKIDSEKLAKMIESLLEDVNGHFLESQVVIGEVNGAVIRLSARSAREADDQDASLYEPNRCIG